MCLATSGCSALTGFGDLSFDRDDGDAGGRIDLGMRSDAAVRPDATTDGALDMGRDGALPPSDVGPMDGGPVRVDTGPIEPLDLGLPRDTSMVVCTSSTACDDANPCTTDECVGGDCVNRPVADGLECGLGDACSNPPTCVGGVCTPGGIVTCFEMRPCFQTTCDPLRGCGVPQPAGAFCDDGDGCTAASACDGAGACLGTMGCLEDMDPCTTQICIDSDCVGVPVFDGGTCPGGLCCDGICVNTMASNTDCGTCGHPCSGGTSCRNGTCANCSTNEECNDGLGCTTDACDGVRCTHVVATGCFIDGQCFRTDQTNPSNSCERCATNGQTTWVPSSDGTPCQDGIACTMDDACQAGACVGGRDPCVGLTIFCTPYYCDEAAGGMCMPETGDPCPGLLLCCADSCVLPIDCRM